MELVLTEARSGGFRAHRPTCKKIGDEQFDPEELTPEQIEQSKPCSSCKPKDVDFDAMVASVKAVPPTEPGEAVSLGEDDEDGFLDDDDLIGASAADREVLAPETLTDEERDALAELDTPDDEDLVGEPEPKRKAPKAAPAAKPAKAPELKAEEATWLLDKVANHLGIELPENLAFPGFGKAVKTEAKQTVYLNSKGTADVRANSREQADEWVEAGLAERRGGNYVRVAVRDL